MDDPAQIAAPVQKAASALGAGVGASALSVMHQSVSFMPTDFGGWAAAGASVFAVLLNACLFGEWIYKKALKPLLQRYTAKRNVRR